MRPHLLRAALLAALLALPAAARAAPPAGKLTWYGQACFLLETAAGTRIVMDPIPKGIGYELPQGLKADTTTSASSPGSRGSSAG
jgi:L-ascorbate metabolism protein UlaG (beta-lactamase superfamily)